MIKNWHYVLIGFLVLLAVLVTGTLVLKSKKTKLVNQKASDKSVTWQLRGEHIWQASGTPPACPEPLNLQTPTDVSKVAGILYPGQPRGPEFKPHGGFRFTPDSKSVVVTVPFNANVVRGSNLVINGERQYAFELIAPCGIMFTFGHLRELSPKFQAMIDTLPPNDERSTYASLKEPVPVKTGEVVATAVGYVADQGNVFFDWGVYDLRQKNGKTIRLEWSKFKDQFDQYGVCWLDFIPPNDLARLLALKSTGDVQYGNESDYCKKSDTSQNTTQAPTATKPQNQVIQTSGAGTQGIDVDLETGLVYIAHNGSNTCKPIAPGKDALPKGANTLSIVDPAAGKETVNIETEFSPIWPTVDTKRKVVYVAGSGGTIGSHKLGEGTKIKSLKVGGLPHMVGLSNDGILVVSNTNDGSQTYYSAVNADTFSLIGHFESPKFPHAIVYNQDKNIFYMIGVESGKIVVIDAKTGLSERTFSANKIDKNSAQMALAPVLKQLFVSVAVPKEGINVIDAEKETIVNTFDFARQGSPPTSLAIDESRGLLFVVRTDFDAVEILDLKTGQTRGSIAVDDCPYAVRLDTKRGLGFVSSSAKATLTVFNLDQL